jgi:hypothetical protein
MTKGFFPSLDDLWGSGQIDQQTSYDCEQLRELPTG